MIIKLRKSKDVLLRIAFAPDGPLSVTVKNIIKDDSFWGKLEEAFLFLSPVLKSIAFVERDLAKLSDIPEIIDVLCNRYTEDSEMNMKLLCPTLLTTAEWRKTTTIFTSRLSVQNFPYVYYVANMLDPRYRGKVFSENEEKLVKVLQTMTSIVSDLGIACTSEEKSRLSNQFTMFRQKRGIFAVEMLSSDDPISYWRNMSTFSQADLISKFALRLFSIPISSAGVERSFSIQSALHTKNRNGIASVKVEKLMKIKWALKKSESVVKKNQQLEIINFRSYIFEDIDKFEHEVAEIGSDDEDLEENGVLSMEDPFTESELEVIED